MARTTAELHAEDVRDVREMIERGDSPQEIADTMGRSLTTVYALIKEAGCADSLQHRPWTNDEKARLLDLAQGVSAKMGRTVGACVSQLESMGY